ncbi:hypothetical protein SEMRO_2461_G328300.1 [Seminavis robusta]|uniref:Uncharacterized protein n=1 Tax=Seminavis robusta TaxID=568900 RepID=A0A9N8EZQ8_9STRA|nr:hypothetical protein SEMRO_2461_G328300.1 [Seminavis robusta]|eukprot:Sro2461_g328300.1 n/a (136) ;mRNA; r:5956-6363
MVTSKVYPVPFEDKLGEDELNRLKRRINEALFNDKERNTNVIVFDRNPLSDKELDEVMTYISSHAIVTSVKHTMDAIEATTEDDRKVNITLFFGGICFNRKIVQAKKKARESVESADSAFGAFEDVTGQGLTQNR